MRGLIALSLAALAAAAPAINTETIHGDAAPILSSLNAEVIPNSYIVKFKKHVNDAGASDHHVWVQDIHNAREDEKIFDLRKRSQVPILDDIFRGLKQTYKIGESFLGYAGHFDDSVIEQIRRHPDVEYIERDSVVYASDFEIEDKPKSCDGELEKMAPWGLARLSHRQPLSFSTYNKYLYANEGGEGVDAYVIDTGTNTEHVDFEGRARWGKTVPENDADEDGNGHGTHCSGTIAGKKYGVAKKANVVAVKVLRSNGSGSMADVVGGVEFAIKSHLEQVEKAKKGKRKGFKGSVANMSLGGGKTQALDDAVNAAVSYGLHFAVAAGNDNADACKYSPAAANDAVTVGATQMDDSRAYFSNWGKCVDIFGPGVSIQSAWIGSKYATNTISGTSMASPHICGLLAYLLSLQPASDSEYSVAPISPEKLKASILNIATQGAISDLDKDSPNLLAWNGGGCSNYTSIVEEGSYKVTSRPDSEILDSVTRLENAIEHDFEVVEGKLVKGVSSFGSKAEKFSQKIHDIVEEELREFWDEVTA